MSAEINYDRIRNAGDHVMPDPFPDYDVDGQPGEGEWLHSLEPGTRVMDRRGQRFLLMAHGPMQSAVVLRDRYRAMFYADGSQRLKVVAR